MYDILERAIFTDGVVSVTVDVKPGASASNDLEYEAGTMFCLKEINWKYSVDAAIDDSYGWPKKPLQVTIPGVCKERVESPLKINPPHILPNNLRVSAYNPSQISVKLIVNFVGVHITPKNGEFLSPKEALAYSLLDNGQRGMLAFAELTGHFPGKLGMNVLPGQPTTALPGQLVNALPQNQALALPPPQMSEETLTSLIIGDLVTYQISNPNITLKVEDLKQLAEYLVKKGWKRGS